MTLLQRHLTRQIHLGSVPIGGSAPISIQSMTTTKTSDPQATLEQIEQLHQVGCDIVRIAIPDEQAAGCVKAIVNGSPLPVVADIHFSHVFALQAIEAGVQGLRINPGNIGSPQRVATVAAAARMHRTPIRIGVNAGSLEKEILQRHGHPGAAAMVESALGHVALLELHNFDLIKISLKASDVQTTMDAYRLIAQQVDYPLHLGVTEAGTLAMGTIKSAIGIGGLLSEGIGDTLRVSLTADPVEEVKVGRQILQALGLRREGVNFISCPTCGRVEVDLMTMAAEVEEKLAHIKQPITVAIMGCAVNGPGEAREADYGIAGGRGRGLLMRRGETIGWYEESQLVKALLELINRDMNTK
ncbi:flavodoxin-dependent (E)-4-hydroxy-3-methylbut-2-enyl-diphosphate synthase [Desulfurispira natronophila]|uniref:4-hydroxy-3-methylbut-2-en-1-yl diphosphate synthase (flavodoxin) n=1 Tax=Desulfurispira natronophila TaxID=682562 RepID=A0A7W7Y502_9BACT|nr:flavodoxin-dependent (E)-4-hydroxy-3-methylbut-2-enyl-diphosphate synthase [Desulfurispira natronophila]MBB5022213.1 (E)-4-hydroxy-3-methylbut-2-enyl-diphosphate synthase [Desulfurispira natronophila]